MLKQDSFEVIIIGGSYSGLSAGLGLARASRKVLIIDSGQPCNSQTPHSHNFLTQDGTPPAEIAAIARKQLKKYDTVHFVQDKAVGARNTETGFEVQTARGARFLAKKVIMATGLRDVLPEIVGVQSCWGISVIHCPYCHGYEFKGEVTGIISNGSAAVGLVKMISNWSNKLTLFTNGASTLSKEETDMLQRNKVQIVESKITELVHQNGQVQQLLLEGGRLVETRVLYLRAPVEQHSNIPISLGAVLTEQGLLQVDENRQTTVPNLYACGDNSAMRSVSTAVYTGSVTAASVNLALTAETFV